MMKRRAAVIIGSLMVAVAVVVLGAAVSDRFTSPSYRLASENTEAVARGKAVYAAHCAACHGPNLEGQANWRERMPNARMPAPPHDAEGHTWHHPDRVLFEITKHGPGKIVPGYVSDMPGFAGTLSDADIWAVLSFIESTWPEEVRSRRRRINEQGASR